MGLIVQVIGETIAAIKLDMAAKWDQLWTDATTRRQCPFQALLIGLMDENKKIDPGMVSSCIFLEDESAETTVESKAYLCILILWSVWTESSPCMPVPQTCI